MAATKAMGVCGRCIIGLYLKHHAWGFRSFRRQAYHLGLTIQHITLGFPVLITLAKVSDLASTFVYTNHFITISEIWKQCGFVPRSCLEFLFFAINQKKLSLKYVMTFLWEGYTYYNKSGLIEFSTYLYSKFIYVFHLV